MPTPTFFEVAQGLLDGTVAAFTAASDTLPEWRYVSPGPSTGIAFDCEQVVVTMERAFRGGAGRENTSPVLLDIYAAAFTVTIVRCYDADNPTPDAWNAIAQRTLTDAQILRDAGSAILDNVVLDERLSFTPGNVNTIPPQGGVTGVTFVVTVDL